MDWRGWAFVNATATACPCYYYCPHTSQQDWWAGESVQRGVTSPHCDHGPLARNENAVYDWVTMLAGSIAAKPSTMD